MVRALTCALILSIVATARTNDTNTTETCSQLYEKAVEAYLENRFEDCVVNFEEAISKYREYKKKLSYCRLKCMNEAEQSEPLYPVDIANMRFFENVLRQTLCLMSCENEYPIILENYYMNMEVRNLFEELKPYEYLQLCYYQTGQQIKAASSAFTYLVAHPDDKTMNLNLKNYLKMDQVDQKDIVNYEAQDYVYMYVFGSRAYEGKHWKEVVHYMEESLSSYLEAEDECRAHCEGPFDHGWYPDFVPAVSNHFTVNLRCKQKCRKQLGSLNGELHDDLMPSHYDYLQFAYFNLGNIKAACRAVASYLLFFPNDEVMLANKVFYSKSPKIQDGYFHPREEAIQYFQRQTYEDRLINFITKEFQKTPRDSQKVIVQNTENT